MDPKILDTFNYVTKFTGNKNHTSFVFTFLSNTRCIGLTKRVQNGTKLLKKLTPLAAHIRRII